MKHFWYALVLILFICLPDVVYPFGKNKVNRETYTWKILQSVHFDIYYPRGYDETGIAALRTAEEGYRLIAKKLHYEPKRVIPIIVYPTFSSFQENNVTDSLIGEGTGGFTEFFKSRVVVPYSADPDEFRHVLTHELVHAFEFSLFTADSSSSVMSAFSLSRIPLWVMEGLAEYISAGYDRSCDQVMRDIICNEKYAHLDDLTRGYVRSPYLFYKEGQSFYYFMEKRYGANALRDFLFDLRDTKSFDDALKSSTGKKADDLSREWIHFLKSQYYPVLKGKSFDEDTGKMLTRHGEDMSVYNLAPAISPDGKKIACITDRGLYAQIAVADYDTKKDLKFRPIITADGGSVYESLNLMGNNLSWSRDGSRLCFAAQSYGKQCINIVRSDGSLITRAALPFSKIYTPSISPDGTSAVFCGGNVRIDLYLYQFASKKIIQLTYNPEIERTPVFTPDGQYIIFARDSGESAAESPLCRMPAAGGEADVLVSGGRNRQPDVSRDGTQMVFVSDRSGIDNIYRYTFDIKKTERLTDVLCGLSYPKYFPDGGRIAYVAYQNLGFDLLSADIGSSAGIDQSDRSDRILEPPLFEPAYSSYADASSSLYAPALARDGFFLFGGGMFGKGGFVLTGLVQGSASDALGDHRVNGILEYYGMSDHNGANADASYWYLKERIDFGAGIFTQSSPYGILSASTVNELVHNIYADTTGVSHYGAYGIASYPFTRFLRADVKFRSSRYEWEYFHRDGVFANLNTISASLNIDTVAWGFLFPIDGWRGMIGADYAADLTGQDYSYTALHADIRRYFLLGNEYVFALRGAGGRILGRDRSSFKYSLGGFDTLRGYYYGEFEGEKMFMCNAEFRFIFIEGIKFGFPLYFGIGGIGGVIFADAGAAWDDGFALYNADRSWKDLKADAGFGFRLALAPLISLKLDFGWPYNRKNFGSVNTLLSLGIDY